MSRSCRAYLVVLALVAELTASALLTGCGGAEDELPREAVSGTVKISGEPMKDGRIQFQPTAQGGATAGTAPIVDGKYSIARSEGLVPGKYQVLIFSDPSQTAPAAAQTGMPGDSPPAPPAKESIPAKYNAKSKLDAQVTKEGPNTFDFELQAK
jgi:hypothetical protein